jgi:hybrid cluster-associated redox disulfide protein
MSDSATQNPEAEDVAESGEDQEKFTLDMKVGEAMKMHPKAQFVFASYHLGGCSHCAISEHETIEQVCYGYGIPPEDLLESLNSLLEDGEDPDIEM